MQIKMPVPLVLKPFVCCFKTVLLIKLKEDFASRKKLAVRLAHLTLKRADVFGRYICITINTRIGDCLFIYKIINEICIAKLFI